MKLKWLGCASLVLESENARILIDPYLRKENKKLPPVSVSGDFDAIFITHPHLDHFSDVGEFLLAGVPKVYVSPNGIRNAEKVGIPTEKMLPLEKNQTVKLFDFTIKTYPSRHCRFDLFTILSVVLNPKTYFMAKSSIRLLKGIKNFKIKDDVYLLSISDGKETVFVLGSAGMDPNFDYPKGCDLLVFPYQGRYGMHFYLKKFLRRFLPKAVTIDHFDDAFPPFTHKINPKKFVPTVEKTLKGAKAFVMEEGKWYSI